MDFFKNLKSSTLQIETGIDNNGEIDNDNIEIDFNDLNDGIIQKIIDKKIYQGRR